MRTWCPISLLCTDYKILAKVLTNRLKLVFSCVLVNGYTSEAFRVTRGVRQGRSLSSLLYILVAETISSAIKKDPLIDGFSLPDGQRVKIFQYADDTSVLVQSDQAIIALFSLFERYERASSSKLNVTKSHGLLLGSWKDRVALPLQFNWSNNFITVLGCPISNDDSVDWASLLDHFSGQLALWKHRQLSF